MKKILSIVFATMMLLPVMAGKTPKMWNFVVNDDGDCIVERVFETEKDGAAALKAVKSVMNKQTFELRKTLSETAGERIEYELKKNTKSRMNPFAGQFREAMLYKMDVQYTASKVAIRCYDFNLENEYEGYGKNKMTDTFAGKISEYEEAESIIATAKGKAKKEAAETMETVNESLNVCEEELNTLLELIKSKL